MFEWFKRQATFCLILCTFTLMAGKMFASSVIFSDQFSGDSLNPQWQVINGQGTYSVSNGLTYTGDGPLSSPSGWSTKSTILALPFQGEHWQADVTMTYSLKWLLSGNYSGPAVPMQLNSSGAQQFWTAVSFDPVTNANRSALAGPNYAAFVRGIDAWYGTDDQTARYGSTSVSGLLSTSASGIHNNVAGGDYWLRFIRDGGSLTLDYSTDGTDYLTAFQTELADPNSSFNELLFTGETYLSAGSSTKISSVTVADTSAPEPGTLLLMAIPLLAVGLKRGSSLVRHAAK